MNQRTIEKETGLSGIGLHTGEKVNISFKPADVDQGINFIRVDLPNKPTIKADPNNICPDDDIPRCTAIGSGDAKIYTVEHLLSALWGLGICNLTVEIDSNETPGLDGSSIEYYNVIKEAGIKDQDKPQEVYVVQEPMGVEKNGASIVVFPSNEFKVSYILDYDNPLMKSQFYEAVIDEDEFEHEVAPCRTFCLEKEADELQKNGLGKGANYDNTLVVGEKGVIKNKLRFDDEFARHKVLDLIGDLYLLGAPIQGHIYAVKSGHFLNVSLLKKISEQKKKFTKKKRVPVFDPKGKKEIDISGIMEILPHRYPFLLVDRVVEVEKGNKAIGIKNVTINDNFFQGHFPTKPVMPGVLMVEAMAQTAGVVILTNKEHHGKVAFFMAIDKVKFRRVVVPGDQLIMEIEVIRDRARTAQVRGVAKVGDDIAAEADMVFSFTDATYLDN